MFFWLLVQYYEDGQLDTTSATAAHHPNLCQPAVQSSYRLYFFGQSQSGQVRHFYRLFTLNSCFPWLFCWIHEGRIKTISWTLPIHLIFTNLYSMINCSKVDPWKWRDEPRGRHCSHYWCQYEPYLIIVIFFTLTQFLENKIYTKKQQFFALNL